MDELFYYSSVNRNLVFPIFARNISFLLRLWIPASAGIMNYKFTVFRNKMLFPSLIFQKLFFWSIFEIFSGNAGKNLSCGNISW